MVVDDTVKCCLFLIIFLQRDGYSLSSLRWNRNGGIMIFQSMPCNSRERCTNGCITSYDIITVEFLRIDPLLDVDFSSCVSCGWSWKINLDWNRCYFSSCVFERDCIMPLKWFGCSVDWLKVIVMKNGMLNWFYCLFCVIVFCRRDLKIDRFLKPGPLLVNNIK